MMTDAPKTGKSPGPIPVGELVQRLVQRKPGAAPEVVAHTRAPFPPVIPEYGAVLTGRLKRYGVGNPPHRIGQPSYFVEILTTGGLRTLWGSDFKRAIEEAATRPKIESLVGVQRVGYQILKFPDGRKLRRNRWRVESVEYFAKKTRDSRKARDSKFRDRNIAPAALVAPAAKPLAAAFHLAQAFADRHIHNPHDRERFLEGVRGRLLSSPSRVSHQASARTKDHEPPSR